MEDSEINIGILVTLFGIFSTLGYRIIQSFVQYRWRKSEFTYNLLRDWHDEYLEEKETIESYNQGIFGEIMAISLNGNSNLSSEETESIKKATRRIMNYFEDVSTYYLLNMVNKQIVHDNMRYVMTRYVTKMKGVIDTLEAESGFPSWIKAKKVYDIWTKEIQG